MRTEILPAGFCEEGETGFMQSFYGVSGTKCYLSLEVKFDYLEFQLSDIFPQRPTNSKRPPKEMPFDIWFKIIIIDSSPLKDEVLTLYWAGLLSNKQPPNPSSLQQTFISVLHHALEAAV